VEEIKFGVVIQHRSFPNGEGDGGWGLMKSEQNVQECDATKDDSSTNVWNKKYNEEIASASPRNKKQ